jgi:membrane protein
MIVQAVRGTFKVFSYYFAYRLQRKAAVMAFYSITTLAPIAVIIVTVLRVFLDDSYLALVNDFFSARIGPEASASFVEMLERVPEYSVSVVSLFAVFIAVVSVFFLLKEYVVSARSIVSLSPDENLLRGRSIPKFISRLFIVGIVLLLLIVANALPSLTSNIFIEGILLKVVVHVVAFIIVIILARLLLCAIGGDILSRRSLLVGAIFIAILSSFLDTAFVLYLQYLSTLTVYGQASYIIVFLLWLYFTAQVYLVGAVIAKHVDVSR